MKQKKRRKKTRGQGKNTEHFIHEDSVFLRL